MRKAAARSAAPAQTSSHPSRSSLSKAAAPTSEARRAWKPASAPRKSLAQLETGQRAWSLARPRALAALKDAGLKEVEAWEAFSTTVLSIASTAAASDDDG